MTGMILAAGLGTRLRPLTDNTPKAMVPVAGRPLVDYALDTLLAAGITDVVINLHHFGEQIRGHLGDGSDRGARIRYSEEHPLLDSGGGILRVRPMLGEGAFVTINADTIVDVELAEVLRFHEQHQALATLVLRKDADMDQFGVIRTDGEGRVRGFLDSRDPSVEGVLEPWMSTGVQVLEPEVFDFMPAGGVFSITRQTYPRMVVAGERVFGYIFKGRWLTVGTPEELELAELALAGQAAGRLGSIGGERAAEN